MARTSGSPKKSAKKAAKRAAKSPPPKSASGGKRRWKPGTVALREIRAAQKSGRLLLQRAPFQRLVRHTISQWGVDVMFRKAALAALQEAAEGYAVQLFQEALILMCHRNRKTLVPKDIFYLRYIRHEVDGSGKPDWDCSHIQP
eukprot:Hpha_TRINITY_DN16525_c0_g2::TRINITY_DN16525_c0_g2_i1::g.136621::m.136621/K11253/H3; histone H3